MTRVARPRARMPWRSPAIAVLTVGLLVAGCSSSGSSGGGGGSSGGSNTGGSASATPAYCPAADQLKTSVAALGQVDVAKNGVSSLTSALTEVEASAKTFADEAKSTFEPQTTALKQSLTALDSAVTAAKDQSPATAAKTVLAPLAQVKNSASDLLGAVSGRC